MQKENIKNVLSALINMKVGLYLGDSQFVEGVLLDVKQDHLIVDVDGNECYFALEHIHAISKNANDYSIYPNDGPHLNSKNYVGVMKALKYNWVTINSLSNQSLFGVLSSIFEDHIILINNQELLYIPKSYISNIHKGISKKENSLLNNMKSTKNMEIKEQYVVISKEKAIQDSDSKITAVLNQPSEFAGVEGIPKHVDHEQVDFEHKETTNDYEKENYDEISILEEQIEKEVINELPDVQSKPQFELSEKIVPLATTGDPMSISNEQFETTGLNNSLVENENLILDENSMDIEHRLERITSMLQSLDVVKTNNEMQTLQHEEPVVGKTFSLEGEHQDVFDSTSSLIVEEQIALTEPPIRNNERRILLTAWSKMLMDQNAVPIPPKKGEESQSQAPNRIAIVEEPPSEQNELLIHGTQDEKTENDEESISLVEIQEPTEVIASYTPVISISPKERKAMLEKQYYALMKHAEQNSINLEGRSERDTLIFNSNLDNCTNNDPEYGAFNKNQKLSRPKEEKAVLEKQFYSLMRHAAKMYRQIRDY